MAAQAGIWYFDSRSVASDMTAVLSGANVTLGPDGTVCHHADGILMLSFAQHFDRLSQLERQPIRHPDGSVLTWDGRLDNRDDFIVRLQADLADDYSDANLIALALAKWQLNALSQAIGDWSLVHWSSRDRRLTLARDYSGNRPLFYYWCREFLAWSTALESIADVLGGATHVNDSYLAGWLAFDTPIHHTCYRDVFKVPPGHAIQVEPRSAPRSRPYMELTPANIRYQRRSDYEDHFRDLLTQAIKVRLRARRRVYVELSGGYDSSTVTCIASALVRAGAVEAPGIQPLSSFNVRAPESDDSRYVQSVEALCKLTSATDAYRQLLDLDPRAYGVPPLAGCQYVPSTQCIADRAGSHVLMTGMFGDPVTGWPAGGPQMLLDILFTGHFRLFAGASLRYCRASRQSYFKLFRALCQECAKARRPSRFTCESTPSIMAAERGVESRDVATVFGLQPEFVRRAFTRNGAIATDRGSSASRLLLASLPVYVLHDYVSAGREWFALRITHPFVHRPLIEYLLALPSTALWSPEHPRAFGIAALRDVLPVSILARGSKGALRGAYLRDLSPVAAQATADLEQWLLVRNGYVDPAALRAIFTRFAYSGQGNAAMVSRLLSAEVLLRRIHAKSRRRANTEPLVDCGSMSSRQNGREWESQMNSTYTDKKGGERVWST
jgi:asparagine synthase (glutamine-hydrolysing)